MPDEVKESAEHWDAMYAAPRSMTWHSNEFVFDVLQKKEELTLNQRYTKRGLPTTHTNEPPISSRSKFH
jgi:hypothetical protein